MQWLDGKQVTVESTSSPLGFETTCEVNTPGSRYLTVNGQRAFDMGNYCGTCSFLFDRLETAPLDTSPGSLDGPLRAGIRRLDIPVLDTASILIPPGEYEVCLLAVTPRLVRPFSDEDYFAHEQASLWGPPSYDYWTGLPHFTHTAYYRADDLALDGSRQLFQFLVPLFPPAWVDLKTVSAYVTRLEAGDRPTALALSVLDVKGPAVWSGDPAVTEHWCLAHYIVDGHHKVYAAAQAGQPITLMTFLARDKGASTPAEVNTTISRLRMPTWP